VLVHEGPVSFGIDGATLPVALNMEDTIPSGGATQRTSLLLSDKICYRTQGEASGSDAKIYCAVFRSSVFCAVTRGRNKVRGLLTIGRNPYRW